MIQLICILQCLIISNQNIQMIIQKEKVEGHGLLTVTSQLCTIIAWIVVLSWDFKS